MKNKIKVINHRIEFIDPMDCGSTVGYSIHKGNRITAYVYLTDCNRKIDWYFHDKTAGIKKINKAIEILQEFRDNFKNADMKRRKKK
jgi:hypothetical protein